MTNFAKHALCVILVISIIFSPIGFIAMSVSVSATTYDDLNKENVFLKQQTSVTCTLSSTAMLMRRTAIAAGFSDWEEITEYSIRETAWVDGLGLLWNFSCYNMTVGHDYFTSENKKQQILDLLDKYPQGIVIYNSGNEGQTHAVFLCDYDSATDTFYVADPANGTDLGRIPLSESSIRGETQNDQIENISAYWYVASPTVTVGAGSSNQNPDNEFSPVDYKTTASVLNVRNKAVDGEIIGKLLNGSVVTVIAIENGWGKINHHGAEGWISLEYAEKIGDSLVIDSMNVSSLFVFKGKSATCSVTASGGSAGYKYKFSVLKDDNAVYNGEYKSESAFTYKFNALGTYIITCTVMDAGKKTVLKQTSKILVINANDGDVNNDGSVTASDARLVLRYSAEVATLTAQELKKADINHDGNVTSSDARNVLRYSASLL